MVHKINRAIVNLVIGLSSLVLSASLQAMTLSIDAGSSWCFDNLAPGFGCVEIQNLITGHDGIRINEVQPASGSHSGPPDGSENPGIDNPWVFFGNTGMHLTTVPVSIITQSSNSMALDFSGWGMTWNTIPFMSLGTGAWTGNRDGVAQVTCSSDCGHGDTYQLHYSATLPEGDPSSYGGAMYALDITGTISTVPIPAAIWLFGSGIFGLIGIARRKKS